MNHTKVPVKLWVHYADKLLKREQLLLHPALISKEVLLLQI